MSQRLAELQRQRALLHEHLAWLDREIAAEAARHRNSPAPGAVTTTSPTLSPLAPVAAATTRVATPPAPDTTLASAADETFASSLNLAPASTGASGGPAGAPADAILDQYRTAPDSLKHDVRKGCFLYFGLAFVLLGVGVAALYFLFRI